MKNYTLLILLLLLHTLPQKCDLLTRATLLNPVQICHFLRIVYAIKLKFQNIAIGTKGVSQDDSKTVPILYRNMIPLKSNVIHTPIKPFANMSVPACDIRGNRQNSPSYTISYFKCHLQLSNCFEWIFNYEVLKFSWSHADNKLKICLHMKIYSSPKNFLNIRQNKNHFFCKSY
jgi:hypothetical protein